jgi:hypothetical protein
MKILLDKSKIPHDGKQRVKDGFLLFPKILGSELRWLVYARWCEKFRWNGDSFEDGGKWEARYWIGD